MVKLVNHTISAADWRDIQRFAGQVSPDQAIQAHVLRARFARVALGQPKEAILSLIPSVWQLKSWPTNFDQLSKLDLGRGAPWTEERDRLPLMLEIARGFAQLRQDGPAFTVMDVCRARMSTTPQRILGADAMGDCLMLLDRYSEAVSQYELAKKALAAESAQYPLMGDMALVSQLLAPKLDEARRLADISAYGPAFVIYRTADRQRRFEDRPIAALVGFGRLREEFPNSVYAEAATAYTIECLFDCATGQRGDVLGKATKEVRDRTDQLMLSLNDLAKLGASDEVKREQVALLEEQRQLVAIMQSLPEPGERSAAKALAMANAFIEERKLGLYRGEVMIDVGDYFMRGVSKPADAVVWYDRAIAWYQTIRTSDEVASIFDIDPRVLVVSAPPAGMKKKDAWGNEFWSDSDPGTLINHRSCSWYADRQIFEARTKRALGNFATGHIEAIPQDLAVILDIDSGERTLKANGLPNSYDRLVNGMSAGRMMATREELALFQGQVRIPLLMAELAYETENWKRAWQLYSDLSTRFDRTLSPSAKLYLDFVTSGCLLTQGRQKEALDRLDRVILVPSSPTWPRAMMSKYNILIFQAGKESEALAILDKITTIRPGTPDALRAMFVKAEYLAVKRRMGEAQSLFEKISAAKDAPDWMHTAALNYMAKYISSSHQLPSSEPRK